MSIQDKWFKYTRGSIYLQRVYPCLKGDFELYPKFFRVPLSTQIYYGNENILEWYLEKKWAMKLGKTIIEDFYQNNKYAKKFRKEWDEYYIQAKKFGEKIVRNINLKSLNDNQIKKAYVEWFSSSEYFNAYSNATIDAVDEVLQDDIRKELRRIIKDKVLFEEAWRILTTPQETTYIQERDLEVLRLVRKIKADGNRGRDLKKYQKEIKEIVSRYWWTTMGWMVDAKYLEPQVKKEIKTFLEKDNLERLYWRFENFSKTTDEAKRKELVKIGASEKLKRLLQIFEEIAIFKDQRKEGQVYLIASNKIILEEIARRKKELSYKELVWLTDTELIDYLDGKKGLGKISIKRRSHSIVVVSKKEIQIKEGKAALELRNKIFSEESRKKVKEIKGLPASRGSARGKVFVTLSSEAASKKMKKGEILVTSQTTPDFVPAMRLAGAVITDEGGATSHAAIISRELNIPCIVGAKVATQVLKTGDRVEVDATKGIIKILE